MSGAIVWATAEYRSSRPGVLVITEDMSGTEHEVPYPHARQMPTTRALVQTPWSAAAGGTWAEGREGCWRIRVFRHG